MKNSNSKTFIIAEAGVNHNGNINIAKQLIDVAQQAGVDAIKFQTFKAENLVNTSATKANYQIQHTSKNESQLEMLKSLELSYQQFLELSHYCTQKNILFLSTPFDLESIHFLDQSLKIPLFKIPSGDITHIPYLRKIAQLNKPTILSTGMSTLDEIQFAITTLYDAGLSNQHLSLLHCTTEYPCPFGEVNLNAMLTMKDAFNLPIGYSDHTTGISVSVAAVAMGATVIEKHFTLDKTLPGPDHSASLEPQELQALVTEIRHIESALGSSIKQASQAELKNIAVARKSIVAKLDINKGDLLSEDNLICKRPGSGISASKWDDMIGTHATKSYKKDELLS